PPAPHHVLEVSLDLRTVERALARLDAAGRARGLDRVDQHLLRAVPHLHRADELLGPRRDVGRDTRDAEVVVDLGAELHEAVDLVAHVFPRAVDVRVVLGHGAHAGQSVQRARALVAVQARELGQPQRQLTVRALAGAEQQTVTRAVHRLHAELFAL